MARFNVLYLSSELFPFVKVGGLGDVAGALPKYLKDQDHDIRVLIPKYKMIRDRKFNLREVIRLREIEVPLGNETVTVSVKSGFIPDSKVQAYFLEYKPLFDRADVYVDPKTGEGWDDNDVRFALFARSAFEMLKVLYWQPDIIHVNDWTSALVPFYLENVYKKEPFFQNVKTVLTIHNLEYQGIFSPDVVSRTNLDVLPFDENHPAWFHGQVNFLKAGLLQADKITTVSPTYAQEILQPERSFGLSDVLEQRKDILTGIINGIDALEWDPETDGHLATNYTQESIEDKAGNRRDLCEAFGLEVPEDTLLIGMVSRLASHKGFALLDEALEKLMELPVALVILGTGQEDIHQVLDKAQTEYPGRLAVRFEHNDELAHKIIAGADAFLMPSKTEPCGLPQMYSQRYGTIPIVHATGGLADTVQPYDKTNGEGTGFVFHEFTAEKLINAVKQASDCFADTEVWRSCMFNAMQSDYSWEASTEKLLDVYSSLIPEVVS